MSSVTILATGKGPFWCRVQDFSAAFATAPVRFAPSSSRRGPPRHSIRTCPQPSSNFPVRTATRENGVSDTTRDSREPSSFRIAGSASRPSTCFSCISRSARTLSARVVLHAGRFRACDPDRSSPKGLHVNEDSPTGPPCSWPRAPAARRWNAPVPMPSHGVWIAPDLPERTVSTRHLRARLLRLPYVTYDEDP
jgi:hypothetical protein